VSEKNDPRVSAAIKNTLQMSQVKFCAYCPKGKPNIMETMAGTDQVVLNGVYTSARIDSIAASTQASMIAPEGSANFTANSSSRLCEV
jgi:hypothetical protein